MGAFAHQKLVEGPGVSGGAEGKTGSADRSSYVPAVSKVFTTAIPASMEP